MKTDLRVRGDLRRAALARAVDDADGAVDDDAHALREVFVALLHAHRVGEALAQRRRPATQLRKAQLRLVLRLDLALELALRAELAAARGAEALERGGGGVARRAHLRRRAQHPGARRIDRNAAALDVGAVRLRRLRLEVGERQRC